MTGDPFVLVSGFGPYGKLRKNPSGGVARALDSTPWIHGVELPVSYRRAHEILEERLAELEPRRPTALLGLGVHRGRAFRIEKCARPVSTSDALDIDGAQGRSVPLEETDERTCELDLVRLGSALRRGGAEGVELSETAGGYVCERFYWHLLGVGERLGIPALFVHVPPLHMVGHDKQVAMVRSLADDLLRQARGARAHAAEEP